jgi:glucan 1,4-alpha-glucosidase
MTDTHSHDDTTNRTDDEQESRGVPDGGTNLHTETDQCDFENDVHRPEPTTEQNTWMTGETYGVGTACGRESRVWFTLTEGALSQPRFPRVDLLQFRLLDFLVVEHDGDYTARTHNETRLDDDEETITRTTEPGESCALVFRQQITENSDDNAWELDVEYVTDPDCASILLDISFRAHDGKRYDLYVVGESAINGYMAGTRSECIETDGGYALASWDSGNHEPAFQNEDGQPYDVAGALTTTSGFPWATVGSYDDEHIRELFERGERHELEDAVSRDAPGETGPQRVLVGSLGTGSETVTRTVALGFAEEGDTAAALEAAQATLAAGYEDRRGAYVEGWESYLDERPVPDAVAGTPELEAQYYSALMVLRAAEDKTFRGAGVASPCVPWGDNVDASVPRDYGYNFTWSRDLYQVFTALSAVGDTERARHAVEYLYEYQQREDGFLPQNTYLDGRTRWDGEQLDNIAYPSVMVYQLDSAHDIGFADISVEYADVRRSLEYLLREGPRTEQERWEEEDGYSPSTIAAVAAGLGCGAQLAAEQGERADALVYLAHADQWRLAVDDWCGTEEGTDDHDQTPYYVRITDDAEPDEPSQRELANNGPTLDERDIVDAGFLELVRLGLRTHDEQIIQNSLSVVDETIRVDTPNGPAWYRYNGDGYGELGPAEPDEGGPWSTDRNGTGRLWPLLTGERGEYELLAGTDSGPLAPENLLESLAQFANSGRMLPEQVWDKPDGTDFGWEFGEGTGAATPLAWTMAQYVRLAHSIDAGEPVETPAFLARRYRTDPPDSPALSVEAASAEAGTVHVDGQTDGDEVVVWTPAETVHADVDDGTFRVAVDSDHNSESEGTEIAVVAATDAPSFVDVGTTLERFTLDSGEDS